MRQKDPRCIRYYSLLADEFTETEEEYLTHNVRAPVELVLKEDLRNYFAPPPLRVVTTSLLVSDDQAFAENMKGYKPYTSVIANPEGEIEQFEKKIKKIILFYYENETRL